MIHLIHGDEEFLRSRRLAEIKAGLGSAELVDLNTTELDGAHLTAAELQRAADVVPFLSERRLIIVRGLLKRLKGERRAKAGERPTETALLLDYLERVPATTELVFIEDETLRANHPILKRLDALARKGHARIHLCRAPSPRALPDWIRHQMRAKGGTISPGAAAALADAIGSDLRLIDTELDKLIAYAGDSRHIETQDVEAIVPYAQVGSVFNLTDAIAERRAGRAFRLLHQLRESGAAVPYLLTMINRQFRILLQVGEAANARMRPPEIAARFHLQEFVVKRAIRQAAHWTTESLIGAFDLLLETDVAIKTGRADPDAALDLLVIELLKRPRPRRSAAAPSRGSAAG